MDNPWEDFLANLKIDLPEKGLQPPEDESIDEGDIPGTLVKVSFDVIMFMNHQQTKYLMMQSNQRLTNLGEISLKEAVIKYNKPQRKRKT